MRSTAFITALLLASAAFAVGCNKPAPGDGGGEPAAPNSPAADKPGGPVKHATAVEVQTVTKAPFERTLQVPGRFAPARTVRVGVEVPGRLHKLFGEAGTTVKKGDLLVQLDDTMHRAQLAQADAGVAQADAAVAMASNAARRAEKLFAAKVIDRAAIDQARLSLKQAQAARKVAAAGRKVAVASMLKLRVESPVSGVVLQRNTEPGEIVGPGAPLFVIGEFDTMKLIIDVPERDIGAVSVGAEVPLTVAALHGQADGPDKQAQRLMGKVTRVPRVAHTKTRTFPVEIAVENTSGKLRAGMMARASLVLERLDNQVVVPVDALVDEPTATLSRVTTVVFIARDGKAHRQVVVSGATQGDRIVIRKGLQGGEKLIVVGQRRVVHGDRIRVVEPKLAPEAAPQKKASPTPELAKGKKATKPVALVN